jgi:DNA ligase-1
MLLDELFARTNTGAVQSWTVEVEGDQYRTVYGQVGGKFQTTNWTKCYTTNEGRANERNPEQQALFEAEALWKKKLESGYFKNIEDVDNETFIEPMLAKKFEDYEDEILYPVFSQPKLDGLRAVATKRGLYSRNGKQYVSCPHVMEALKPFFAKFPDAALDGELYNHSLKHDFNRLTSLIKKTKPNTNDLKDSAENVQYWVYDVVIEGKLFEDRSEFVTHNLPPHSSLCVVPTDLANNSKELDELYGKYVGDGFEGQMVRLNRMYENKRSKFLLKRKEFQDQEYKILNIIEGEGNKTGMAGAMVFVNELGHEFNSNIKGTREFLTELWVDKQKLIGQLATVQYFNKTPDKAIPRFPYVVKIRCEQDLP